MSKIGITFGAMADPIIKQLLGQDVTKIPDRINAYQEDADAITRLSIKGLLAESETRRARMRLLKIIIKNLDRGAK